MHHRREPAVVAAPAATMLRLQHAAGNRAVAQWVERVRGPDRAAGGPAGSGLGGAGAGERRTVQRHAGHDGWRTKQPLESELLNTPALQTAAGSAAAALEVGQSRGDAVGRLQQGLTTVGFAAPASATFDRPTQQANAAFQAEHGIPYPTGRQAGPKTLSTLDDHLAAAPPPTPTDDTDGWWAEEVAADEVEPEPAPDGEPDVPILVQRAPADVGVALTEPAAEPFTEPAAGPGPGDAGGPTPGPAGDPGTPFVSWRGSFRDSLYHVIANLVDGEEQRAQVLEAAVARETKYHAGKSLVDLVKFEHNVEAGRAGGFGMGGTAVQTLATLTKRSPDEVRAAAKAAQLGIGGSERAERRSAAARAVSGQGKEADLKRAELRGPVQPREKFAENIGPLADPTVAQLYLLLQNGWLGMPEKTLSSLTPIAQRRGLSAAEIALAEGGSPLRRFGTLYFGTLVPQHEAKHGKITSITNPAMETIFRQLAYGNPGAKTGVLQLGVGTPENEWGVVHKPSGVLYYAADGHPLMSVSGTRERDPGFAGVPQMGEVTVSDPGLLTLIRILRSVGTGPAQMAMGAERYFEFKDAFDAAVQARLPGAVKEVLEDTLVMLIGFLGFKGLAWWLKSTGHPAAIAVGAAIDGILLAAEWYLNLDFLGSSMQRLIDIGTDLSMVSKDDTGAMTVLAQTHFGSAADKTARTIADIGTMLALHFASKAYKGKTGQEGRRAFLKDARSGEKVNLHCNTCYLEPLERSLTAEHTAARKSVSPENLAKTNAIRAQAGLKPLKSTKMKDGSLKVEGGGRVGEVNPAYTDLRMGADGTVSGPHQEVQRFNTDTGNAGLERGNAQSHHVLEHSMIDGFLENPEASYWSERAVSIEQSDHALFTTWMEAHRGERSVLDIHHLFDLHRQMYSEHSAREMHGLIETSMRELAPEIARRYKQGKVPTAGQADFASKRRPAALAFLARYGG